MSNTERTAPFPMDFRTGRYSTRLARLVNSRLYRSTLSVAIASPVGRLALLASIPLLWIAAFVIGPLYELVKVSFLSRYPIRDGGDYYYTLDNYALFFNQSLYFIPLIRSLVFALATTATTLVVVYPVAYYVARIVKPRNRVRALLLLLLPFWAGELIRTFSVVMLLANRGAINALLLGAGLIDRPITMLYTPFSLNFGVIYLIALYMLLPLYSALEKIPAATLEAAADLGAGPLARFRRVILPLSRDGIVSGCCLVFLTSIGLLSAPLLLGGPSTVLFPETVGSLFLQETNKWPAGAAFAMIMLVAALTTTGLFMRLAGRRKVVF